MRSARRCSVPDLRGAPTREHRLGGTLGLVLLALSGCRDLSRFDTGEDEAYCGTAGDRALGLVSAPFAHEGFVPENVPPVIAMRLSFDSAKLATSPGAITTDDGDRGLCAHEGRPLFDEAPLRSVSEAFHDPISQLEFGDGREQNVLCWVDSTCLGSMLGVLSLMRDGDVELRLFKPRPAPSAETPQRDRPGYAEFVLSKRKGDCGF